MDLDSTLQTASDLHLIDHVDDRAFLTERFDAICSNHKGPWQDGFESIIRVCAGVLLDEDKRLRRDYIDLICEYQPWLADEKLKKSDDQLFGLPYILLAYGGVPSVDTDTLKKKIDATTPDFLAHFVMVISILKQFDNLRRQCKFDADSCPKTYFDSRIQMIFPIAAIVFGCADEAGKLARQKQDDDTLTDEETPGFMEAFIDKKVSEYLLKVTPGDYVAILQMNADIPSAIQKLMALNLVPEDFNPQDFDQDKFLDLLIPHVLEPEKYIDARVLATIINEHRLEVTQQAACSSLSA